MPNLAQLAALPVAGASRPPATEVLTSPKSISSKTGTFVAEVQMPLYRKRSNADEAVATARWRAVLARDRAADGSFVFAVKTTGVYCRPSCPARRPKAPERDLLRGRRRCPGRRLPRLPALPAGRGAGDRARRRRGAPAPRRGARRDAGARRARPRGRSFAGASAARVSPPDRPVAQAICPRASGRAPAARPRRQPVGARCRFRSRLRLGIAPVRRSGAQPRDDARPLPQRRARRAYRLRPAQDGARPAAARRHRPRAVRGAPRGERRRGARRARGGVPARALAEDRAALAPHFAAVEALLAGESTAPTARHPGDPFPGPGLAGAAADSARRRR